jgi:RIO kinase 1
MRDRRLEEIDPLEEKLRGATPKDVEDRTVEEALLAQLDPLIEQHLITEVLRPIKTGKEAVVYCCHAHPTLERELVAAKVYRPFETRSFKRDAVYQQGRERGSRPDARVLRALGKKTRHGRLHKFSAWIAHEERTLQVLHDAGADVPEPIERVGPVVLMEYVGDSEHPAPMLTNVSFDEGEAARLYEQVLGNVGLFLKNHRVHADLSAFNLLYWEERAVIIDFPQAVDPRYNDDAFDLLIRDLRNVNDFFEDHGVEVVDPIQHALGIWREHVDPLR